MLLLLLRNRLSLLRVDDLVSCVDYYTAVHHHYLHHPMVYTVFLCSRIASTVANPLSVVLGGGGVYVISPAETNTFIANDSLVVAAAVAVAALTYK